MTTSRDRQDPRSLTFEQREGAAPLPRQLELREISQELRARIWHIFEVSIVAHRSSMGGTPWIVDPWKAILQAKWVYRDHRLEEFSTSHKARMADLRSTVEFGDYADFFGLLEWIIRQPECPPKFRAAVSLALKGSRSAYRIVDQDRIMAISDEAEAENLSRVLSELSKARLAAPREHLKRAASQLTVGNWADSVRESIHAVESVARILAPGETGLASALKKLEGTAKIHGGLKSGLNSIYGYTSDEQGIRHPMIDDPDANVDETDAIFMLGACASFVSYLIGKARAAGLLKASENVPTQSKKRTRG